MTKYAELLRDPRWQKKRLEIMQRDEFTCRSCFDSENTLNVHHTHYVKGNMPWEYEGNSLITLCENCHKIESEELYNAKQRFLAAFSKHGWMSSDYDRVSNAVLGIGSFGYPSEVAATMLAFAIQDSEMWEMIDEKFWRTISSSRKEATNG